MKSLHLLSSLAALALAAGAPGAAPDPIKTQELIAIVQSGSDVAARARALQQLANVATKDAVPAVTSLLADERLGQYARDVLEQMPDPAGGEALRNALGRLHGPSLAGVVNSIGQRRDAQAVAALGRIAANPSSGAAAEALVALGRIGTPEAMRVVEPALGQSAAELRAAAAEGCVLCADRLMREGQAPAAHRIYEAVRRAALPASWRVAATRGAILADEKKGLPLLIEQLHSRDPDMRDAALGTARAFRGPGITPALVAELDRLSPPMQAAVLTVLVDRQDEGSLAAVEARARAGDEVVRVAAIKALGTIGRSSSMPILLGAIQPPSNATVANAAFASLSRISAPDTATAILKAMAGAEPVTKARLIGVLGERKAENATAELMTLSSDTNPEIAKAAFRALGLVATATDLPRLIEAAIRARGDAQRALADQAIVTTSMKVLEPERRPEAVLRAFHGASDPAMKASLLRPLGAIVRVMGGSHDVFFAVRAALQDPAEPVRMAALNCLADWPDATPTMLLLEMAGQKDTAPAEREVALRGAIRMATDVAAGFERSPLNVLEAFRQANRAVRTKDEKMMIVSGLGSLRKLESVQMLQPYLDDPDVKEEAALAVVQVAPALAGAKPAAALKAVLERIAATEKDEDVRQRATRLAQGKPVPPTKAKSPQRVVPVFPAARGQLFNERDLGEWDGDPAVWRLRDGAIVGGSFLGNPRNEFLATKRPYANFVLRLEYKLVGTQGFVNGGVQFRSVRIPEPSNEMSGYQADIGGKYSGSLYDESRRNKTIGPADLELVKRLEKRGDWNRYEIRCEGPRIELSLNGMRTVAYVESDPAIAPTGLIALQIHGGCKAEIAFRNLEIQELP